MRFGADPNSTPPRLLTAWAKRFRGNPRGSHVMDGSFDGGRPPPAEATPAPRKYGLFILNRASPAGVMGGIGSTVVFCGPTQAPERSRLGAGPGGSGILGTPSEINPSFGLR